MHKLYEHFAQTLPAEPWRSFWRERKPKKPIPHDGEEDGPGAGTELECGPSVRVCVTVTVNKEVS